MGTPAPHASPQRPTPPTDLAGFWTWTSDRQEEHVTLLQRDFHWSSDLRVFLLSALQNKTLSLVTRNSMTAGMLRQDPVLSELEPLLLRMCNDPAEDPESRNYTVQFLAEILPTATNRAAVEQVLRTIAGDPADPRAATAVLHLARLGAAGTVALDATFDGQVLAMVSNAQQPAFARATALAVAGERRVAGTLDLARTLAEPGHPSDLRRAAIGVLGSSGESSDLERLQRYAVDADRAVQAVAKANINKI